MSFRHAWSIQHCILVISILSYFNCSMIHSSNIHKDNRETTSLWLVEEVPSFIESNMANEIIGKDYSLGKEVHYKRRNHLSKKIKDTDKNTDIQVDMKNNVVNVKSRDSLRVIKKHIRDPQQRLQPIL